MISDFASSVRLVGCTIALACAAPLSNAAIVHETQDPFGGFLGINGFDVFERQSVAGRFTPQSAHSLDRVSLWLWNNDDQGGTPEIVITLRSDDPGNGESRPSDQVIETWTFVLPSTGVFEPVLFPFESVTHAALEGGVRYWIVAESSAVGGLDPVWAWAAEDSGPMSLRDPFSGDPWWNASDGAVTSYIVEGTPTGGIPGDIDGDGDVDLSDLALLLGAFGTCSGDPGYNPEADLDGSDCVDLPDLALLLANFGS